MLRTETEMNLRRETAMTTFKLEKSQRGRLVKRQHLEQGSNVIMFQQNQVNYSIPIKGKNDYYFDVFHFTTVSIHIV